MKKDTILEYYDEFLFYAYVPINLILWILLATGKSFILGAQSIILISLAFYILFFGRKIKLDSNYLLVILFVLYCFIVTSLNYFGGDLVDKYGRSLANYHFSLYPFYLIAYTYGRRLNFEINAINYIVFTVILILTSTLANFKTFTINYEVIDDSKLGIYLALSDLFVIYTIFLISYTRNNYYRVILFILGCIALLILNSRSALYSFVIIFSIYQLTFQNFRTRILNLIIIFILSIGFINSIYFKNLLESNSRMLAIFKGLDEDRSKSARDSLLETGLKRTFESPILGDYGGVIKEHNNIGSYIHNIFSYWQTFGIIPFLLSVFFFLLTPAYIAYKSYKDRKLFNTAIYFNLSFYLIIVMIFTKPYGWYNAWLILGILHTYNHKKKNSLFFKSLK